MLFGKNCVIMVSEHLNESKKINSEPLLFTIYTLYNIFPVLTRLSQENFPTIFSLFCTKINTLILKIIKQKSDFVITKINVENSKIM